MSARLRGLDNNVRFREIEDVDQTAGLGANSPRYHPRRFACPMSKLINAGVA